MKIFQTFFLILSFLCTLTDPLQAICIDGARLSAVWVTPFAGILLSLALMPIFAAKFWHKHYGKVGLFWIALILFGVSLNCGPQIAMEEVVYVMSHEYLPFILTIGALFTVAGGIHIDMNLRATPLKNTLFLAVSAFIASWIGTTGAAMLFIRPFLSMNKERHYKKHAVIFFIFLVCNVGGSLTALGDPPLFIGFLMGVHFFWPTTNLFGPFLTMAIPLLLLFFAMDTFYAFRESQMKLTPEKNQGEPFSFSVQGLDHTFLFAAIIASVLISGWWRPGITYSFMGTSIDLQDLVRDVALLGISLASYFLLSRCGRDANQFCWEPLAEVAKLFIAIFLTASPVIAMLKAGENGIFGDLLRMVTAPDGSPIPDLYYWITGSLSAFLDNAPTYMVFFHMAGGQADQLMTIYKPTLIAISSGAVFMGALSYIGNAPNFMVKSIAESQRILMPSFFGYMVWSTLFFLPFLYLVAWWFF